jgi:hypothetical protein
MKNGDVIYISLNDYNYVYCCKHPLKKNVIIVLDTLGTLLEFNTTHMNISTIQKEVHSTYLRRGDIIVIQDDVTYFTFMHIENGECHLKDDYGNKIFYNVKALDLTMYRVVT